MWEIVSQDKKYTVLLDHIALLNWDAWHKNEWV